MKFKGLKTISVGAAALNLLLSVVVWAGTGEVALLVQQTPDQAGSVSPPSGVYHFLTDSTVVVTAQAVPGYEFVYWLGDVADPQAVTTEIVLNRPKIVVAVFSPSGGDQAARSFGPGGDAGSYGDGEIHYLGDGGPIETVASPKDYSRTGFAGSSGSSEGGNNVPEPLTVVLLSAGAGILAVGRRRN